MLNDYEKGVKNYTFPFKHCLTVTSRYLNVGHVPRLVTDFLPEDAAQELRDITSQYKQATPQIEGATENTAATEGTTGTAPPNKKVKLRGMKSFKAHAHRRRRVCAAQIATRPVCKEQYISTGSKPEHCVS